MCISSILTIIGLSLDIIGVIGVYYFHIGSGKASEQTPVKLYKRLSTLFFILILVGFGFQIFSQFFN